MPKLKTHKGAAKRFKKTGTGLVVRGHAFARHILTSKSQKEEAEAGQERGGRQVRSAEVEANDPLLRGSDCVRTVRVARARIAN